jgi:5,10-methenyltetrahydromethanopterin hydrogenase
MIRRTRSLVGLFIVLAVVSNVGCHPKAAVPHPNQLNTFDGAAYDRLTEAQAALTEIKTQYAAGKLPTTAKPVINEAGAIYNTAYASWLNYRDILQGKTGGDPEAQKQKMLEDMNKLAQAIVSLRNLIGGK